MRANILYRSRPGVSGIFFVLWLLVCGGCIGAFVVLFDETPGISVMGIFGFLASLAATSKGRITVSKDRFLISTIRLLPGFSDREEYAFSGIWKIEARLSIIRHTIFITYKDGSVDRITLLMDRGVLREALECIREHSHIRVDVMGSEWQARPEASSPVTG